MPYNIDIYSETMVKDRRGKFKNKFQKRGWIQSCFYCDNPTAHVKLYDVVKKGTNTYNYNVYVCPECNGLFLKKPLEFVKFVRYCNLHIRDKYDGFYNTRY